MSKHRHRSRRPDDDDSINESVTIKVEDVTEGTHPRSSRQISLYDAVAGRIGVNGFLSAKQLKSSNVTSLSPEEVLLRRSGTSEETIYETYNADERLSASMKLPDSDLLKAIHAYVSDFYNALPSGQDKIDFRSMDETAMLAFGILIEEAAREILGENGDMVLVEPEGLENGLPESKMTMHQVIGKVEPPSTPSEASEKDDDDYQDDNDFDVEMEASRKKRRLV